MIVPLPGFATPDSPNLDIRAVVGPFDPVQLLVLDNVPTETPQSALTVIIQKAFGNEVLTLFTSADNSLIVAKPGTADGTTAYWLKIMPDELRMLNGTYLIKVTRAGEEVFRKSLTVGYDRE